MRLLTAFISLAQIAVAVALSAEPTIITLAGKGEEGYEGDGGPATAAQLNEPAGIAVDGNGNVYIADSGNHRIRRVDAKTNIIITVAGNGKAGFAGDDGVATDASLNTPCGIAVDKAENLFIADSQNHRIRKVDGRTGRISTIAGDGFGAPKEGRFGGDEGPAAKASLFYPTDVSFDNKDNLIITDYFNHRIRRIDFATGIITTVAGNGEGKFGGDGEKAILASLKHPLRARLDAQGNIFIADEQNSRIRKIDAKTGEITTVIGNGLARLPDPNPRGPKTINAATAAQQHTADGIAALESTVGCPSGIAFDKQGTVHYCEGEGLGRVRKLGPDSKILTIAGGGEYNKMGEGLAATQASLNGPVDIAIDGKGNLYISERGRHRVRVIRAMVAKEPAAGEF